MTSKSKRRAQTNNQLGSRQLRAHEKENFSYLFNFWPVFNKMHSISALMFLMGMLPIIRVLCEMRDYSNTVMPKSPRSNFIYSDTTLLPYSLAEHYLNNEFHFLNTTYVPFFQECRDKEIGASAGKICSYNDQTYILKEIKHPSDNSGNDVIQGEYNLCFIQEVIGVNFQSLQTRFFYESETNKYYHGSQYLSNFKEAMTACFSFDSAWCEYNRNSIVNYLGLNGVAQIAVINTFVKDMHAQNWGYQKKESSSCSTGLSQCIYSFFQPKYKIVILDVDQRPANNLKDYIDYVMKIFTSSEQRFGIELTINDLRRMATIYQAMLKRSPQEVHWEIDLPKELYQTLLTIYIEACHTVIKQYGHSFSFMDNEASYENNEAFAHAVRSAANEDEMTKQNTIKSMF